MKKAAGSFRPAAVGGFLTAHVEKVAFGCLLALALAMTWWGVDAVRSQRVDQARTPAAISALAGQADENIRRAAKIPAGRIPAPRSLSPLIDPWRPGTVELADPPAAAVVLSRPLFAELTKRTKPAVFPIEDLHAVAGIAVLPDPDAEPAAPGIAPRGPDVAAPPESDPRRRPGRRPRGRDRESPEAGGLLGPFGPVLQPEAGGLAAANSQPPGRVTPFVVVTGLIPASRQTAEFEQRFSATSFQDARRDKPRWGVYIVERARVVPGGSLTWERQEVTSVERAQQPGGRVAGRVPAAGGTGSAEAVPLEQETLPEAFFLLPEEADIGYVAPLPQRLDEPWGAVSVHPWFIPRLEEFREARRTGDGDREKGPVDEVRLADLLEDPRGRAGDELRLEDVVIEASPKRQKNVGLYTIGLRSADAEAAVEVGTIGRSTDLVFAMSEAWGERLTVDGTTDEPRASNVRIRIDQVGRTPVARILEIELLDADGKAARTIADPEPGPVGTVGGFGPLDGQAASGTGPSRAENRLFRFFDSTVKSGETYRYRVKFALRNPNAGLSAKHLADPADSKGDFLISEFSAETPPVRVPDATVFLARTIDRDTARKLKMQGLREVMVLAPSEKTGNLALRSTITDVGGLVNVDMELNRPGDVRFFGEPVATDRVLIDARGRQEDRDSRSAEPPEPVEMLFLRPDGGFEFTAAADSERSIRRYGDTLFRPGTQLPDDGRSSRDERDGDPQAPRGTR